MTYQTKFILPALGEGDGGGRIVSWLKHPGETFQADEPVLEIETDKAIIEVSVPCQGEMLEHIVDIDDLVDLGQPIALLEFEGEAPPAAVSVVLMDEPAVLTDAVLPNEAAQQAEDEPDCIIQSEQNQSRIIASPFARKLAREQGEELSQITGSGKGGRIVGSDVLSASNNLRKLKSSKQGIAFDGAMQVSEKWITTSRGEIFAKSWKPELKKVQTTLIMIHGLFAEVDSWASSATVLARRGIHVIAFDLPCHGQSRCNATQFDTIVETMTEAINKTSKGPVAIVGHSFGAAVAARIGSMLDIPLTALVLIAPLGLGSDIDAAFLGGMTHAGSIDVLKREIRKLTVQNMTPGNEFLNALQSKLAEQSNNLIAICKEAAWNGVQQIVITPDLEQSDLPIAIIHGRCDSIIAWQQSLNAPPQVALHLIPNVGHKPHWEASALTTDIITRMCLANGNDDGIALNRSSQTAPTKLGASCDD
jgi:pimeloyl-ACP methyl ester carboxylesterase